MKKYITLLLAIILSFSCENLLDEEPKNFIARENYYQNEKDAEGAINGAYDAISPNYFNINVYLMEELHGDYLNGRGGQGPISFMDQLLDFRGVDYAASAWSAFYKAINRANAVLDNVPDIKNISENVKRRILAEAHFLRALSYFELVRNFGPVPLRLNEISDLSKIGAPREPTDKIYTQIIEDLKAAENELPENVGVNTGRASKWAAKMLMAHVYLTLEKWDLSAEKANEVINSGLYSLVKVQTSDDFYKIFAVQTSSEDIMSEHHSETNQQGIPQYIHIANALPWNRGDGYFAWLPDTNSWIGQSWDNKDLRKSFNFYKEYQNSKDEWISLPSTTPILFKKFKRDPNGKGTYSLPIYRYAETLLFYAEASCMAEGAPSVIALERLNMVKRRAYGYDPDMPSPIDYSSGMNKEEFQKVVVQERAYEFILERRRWYDLKRTRTVKEAFAKVGKTYIDSRLLWPIPYNEINNNPALSQSDQNPGY